MIKPPRKSPMEVRRKIDPGPTYAIYSHESSYSSLFSILLSALFAGDIHALL